jgi:integrase
MVAVHTGMRLNNVLRLHISELDFTNRWIRVRQKNNLPLEIPMNHELYNVLIKIEPHESGFLFVNPVTGKPYTRFYVTWKSIKQEAGITKPFRVHDLRHSFAIKAGRAGIDLRIIQRLLGHSSPDITIRHYAQVLDNELHSAVEKLTCTKTCTTE